MSIHSGNRYTAKVFHEPIIWLIMLWCVGILLGAGFAFAAGRTYSKTIQTLICSDYSFFGNLLMTLSLLLFPYGMILCHLPYKALICLFTFGKGFGYGFFVFACLFSFAESGWLFCLFLQFSGIITVVPILDYWIKCFWFEYERLSSQLMLYCLLCAIILLIERFAISPMLLRLFYL